MDLKNFLEGGGLRVLSLAHLNPSSYSIVLHLLDGLISGAPQLVANSKELSFVLDIPEENINSGFDELLARNIIQPVEIASGSEPLILNLNSSEWKSLKTIAEQKNVILSKVKVETPSSGENLTDLTAFREKHEIYDAKVRSLASDEMKKIKQDSRTITPDEELLLQILMHHHQPRKQLHWALKVRLIYPNLTSFLEQARLDAELSDPNKA